MNLPRNQLAKEPGNCRFQRSTSCDTEQNRESVGVEVRATRQMISTDTKRKRHLSDITIIIAYKWGGAQNIYNIGFIGITLYHIRSMTLNDLLNVLTH